MNVLDFGPNIDLTAEDTVQTPVGQRCFHCEEPIAPSDSGKMVHCVQLRGHALRPIHRNCFLRGVFGSLGHQNKTCRCFGGKDEGEDGMTKRQAADAAVGLWFLRNGN